MEQALFHLPPEPGFQKLPLYFALKEAFYRTIRQPAEMFVDAQLYPVIWQQVNNLQSVQLCQMPDTFSFRNMVVPDDVLET